MDSRTEKIKENKVLTREELLQGFYEEMDSYLPDWDKIIRTNQSEEKLSIDDIINKKMEIFRKRMREMRKARGITQEQMAQRLDCSKQYVSKIENTIPRIYAKKLENYSRFFDVPVAYLIGLTDDEMYVPDKTECYFWENPNSCYNEIKSEVMKERLINPMELFGAQKETLEETVFKKLKDSYDLLVLMDDIMNSPNVKRKKLILIMKQIYKVL